MAFPNTSITDIIATTIEKRSGKIADNVTKNNAILARLKEKGRIRPFSGGRSIFEEFGFAENQNAGWYSGADVLPVAAADVVGGAEFAIKQIACPVVVTGLEELQNSGEEAVIDLVASRLEMAEATMNNKIAEGLYSDGTGSSGKTLAGLDAAVPVDPTTGTYGGINRATSTNAFWRSQLTDSGAAPSASTIQSYMNTLWAKCVRGADRPDLIMTGATAWAAYLASLQALQRFTTPGSAKLGFPSVLFMDADVVLDGGIGGYADADDMYFLNTKYLHFRPHSKRNMVSLKKRYSTNQDVSAEFLAWAGALTSSGPQFCGRLKLDA